MIIYISNDKNKIKIKYLSIFYLSDFSLKLFILLMICNNFNIDFDEFHYFKVNE